LINPLLLTPKKIITSTFKILIVSAILPKIAI